VGSSRVMEEVDAPGLEDDEGKAKSEDEVGRYGRDEAFGMVLVVSYKVARLIDGSLQEYFISFSGNISICTTT
jgi:hypothetical protein